MQALYNRDIVAWVDEQAAFLRSVGIKLRLIRKRRTY